MGTRNKGLETVAGNEVKEGKVYIIHFKDGEQTKWCHAMIDLIEENYIRFRTSANAKKVEVKKEDILEIGADENKIFNEETVCALYRGEIYVEGKNSMESPEYA